MFQGFDLRLQKEIVNLAPSNIRVKVIAPPERRYTAWIGGSILSTLSSSNSMWITKEEYQECGAQIVHSKCF